ncbi:MAG: hypothetical protein AABX38_08320 [Candidatus Micrarchaeota archaeon]
MAIHKSKSIRPISDFQRQEREWKKLCAQPPAIPSDVVKELLQDAHRSALRSSLMEDQTAGTLDRRKAQILKLLQTPRRTERQELELDSLIAEAGFIESTTAALRRR